MDNDYYDEVEDFDELDEELEDDYDDVFDDFDDDEEGDEESDEDFETERMDDSDVEWAGIIDGEADARSGYPMGFGTLYDDLPDDQKSIYELGYNNGFSSIEQEDGF